MGVLPVLDQTQARNLGSDAVRDSLGVVNEGERDVVGQIQLGAEQKEERQALPVVARTCLW